jgi:DNA polymerase-3 subunit gamma/tau
MDAASRTGVGDIRELIEGVRYAPVEARYKVYIIDEVHMLSNQAFNALLKTLEEPPPHVKFIFATTEIRKLPVTVLSRCQRFDLRRIEPDVLSTHLSMIAEKEGVTVEPDGLAMIARAAEGSVRDALSILDQALIQHGRETKEPVSAEIVRDMLGLADRSAVWDLFEAVMKGETPAALDAFRAQYDAGAEPSVVLRDLLEVTHLVTRVKAAGAEAANHGPAGEADASRARALADKLQMNALTRAWSLLMKGLAECNAAPDPAAAGEIALIRLSFAAGLPTPDEALRLLKSQGVGSDGAGSHATAGQAAGSHAADNQGAAPAAASAPVRAPQRDNPYRNEASRLAISTPAHSAAPTGPNASSGGAATARQPRVEARPQPVAQRQNNGPRLSSFADVVRLAADNRDAKLRVELESYVHLIRFDYGRIEMRLHDEAPSDLAGRLVKALKDWTGVVWSVSVNANEKGAATLRDARYASVMADPLVQAVFEAFPKAEIRAIRDSRAADDLTGAGSEEIPLTDENEDSEE